jgi:hypothetical protein
MPGLDLGQALFFGGQILTSLFGGLMSQPFSFFFAA